MSFNELNSVEHLIIKELTGVNLNNTGSYVSESEARYGNALWEYVPSENLKREITEVLLEGELKKALIKINPEINLQQDRADEVIHKLRAILLTVGNFGLVKANEEFAKWMKGEMTMPFGKDSAHVPVKLIDFEDIEKNTYTLTNQLKIRARETKIPDIVLFINGIPVVVGEAKTPVRPAVSWLDGAFDIHDIYENSVQGLFVPNILNFATEGKELRYGAVRTPLEFWCPWRKEETNDELAKFANLHDVKKQMNSLLRPKTLLDILQNFTLYTTNNNKRKMKVVARYQQYEGANAIVERVKTGLIKKGLIWHFQGSGKSLLMVFAAQKMRKMRLKSGKYIQRTNRHSTMLRTRRKRISNLQRTQI